MTALKTGNNEGSAEWRPSERFAPYAEFGPSYRAENAITYRRAKQQALALRIAIMLVLYLPCITGNLVPNYVVGVYFMLWLVLAPIAYCLGIRKIVAPLIVAEGGLPFRAALVRRANDTSPILLWGVEIATTAGCFCLWHARRHHPMSMERWIAFIALWIVMLAIASICTTMLIARQDNTPVRR